MYIPNNIDVPTAKEMLESEFELVEDLVDGKLSYSIATQVIENFMIEFAQKHIQAATDEHAYWCNRDNRDDLIKSYPLTNIK